MDILEVLEDFKLASDDESKFENLISKLEELLRDENEINNKEIYAFLDKKEHIKVLFQKNIISNSEKRKKVLKLIKELSKYCNKNTKNDFNYIYSYFNIEEVLEDVFINNKWKLIFEGKNPSTEELDDFSIEYFDLIEHFPLSTNVLFGSKHTKQEFEESKLYKKIKEFVLTKNFDDISIVAKNNINNICKQCDKEFYDKNTSVIDSYVDDCEEPSDIMVLLKTNMINDKFRTFYEQCEYITEEDKNKIMNYFEKYYAYALKSADKFPEVLNIALYCERIRKFDIDKKTKNREEVASFSLRKHKEVGHNIIQNIDVEAMKSGNSTKIYLVERIAQVLSEGCTLCSEIADCFESLKEAGIDYLETDEFRTLQETGFIGDLIELSEKKEKNQLDNSKEKENNDYSEKDQGLLKLNNFFKDSIKNIIESKVSIFSKKGSCLNHFILVAREGISEYKELYEFLLKEYEIDKIDIKEEINFVDDFIKNKEIVDDENEFGEFLNHLQNIKLKIPNYTLPMKYVKYIIKQVLESNSVISKKPTKYIDLIEIAIEDLARNDLPSKIQKNKPYFYFVANYWGRENINGTHSKDGYIFIKRRCIENFVKNYDLGVFDSCFHENEHASQFYDFKKADGKDISYNRYVMEKEEIISSKRPLFYQDNYNVMFIEIEANEKSAKKLGLFIDSLNLSDKSKLTFLNYYGNNIVSFCEQRSKVKKAQYRVAEIVKDRNSLKNVYTLFDEIIAENPEYLEEYPILKIEYNSDGTPKKLGELLEYGLKAETSREKYLTAKIINKSNRMKPENFEEDITALINCFSNRMVEGQSLNASIGNTFLKKIVVENVRKVGINILDNLDTMQEADILKIKNTISSINSAILDPDKKRFADAMNTLDSRNPEITKTPIQIIEQISEKISQKENANEINLNQITGIQILRDAYEGIGEEALLRLEEEMVESKKSVILNKVVNDSDKKISIEEDILK